MIEVVCDSCLASFRLSDASAGKRLQCKTCGEAIRVPSGSKKRRAGVSSQVDDDDDDEDDYSRPARLRPSKKTAARKTRKLERRSVNFDALIERLQSFDYIGIGSCTFALVVIALFCIGFQYRPAAVGYMAIIVIGTLLVMVAACLLCLYRMVQENPIIVVLCFIFPPYGIYYTYSRWDRVQTSFYMNLCAWAATWVLGYGGLQIYRANGVDVEEWNVYVRSERPVVAGPVPGGTPRPTNSVANFLTGRKVASADASLPFPVNALPARENPDLPAPRTIRGVPGVIYDVFPKLDGGNNSQPGALTVMRVHVPDGEHAPGSLPCILIAPAGATLLTGMKLDNADYTKETAPWVQQGYVVVEYSVDGHTDSDMPNMMLGAYLVFKNSFAGLANGRAALEFVSQKLPQVDPHRIYAVGHSSSGTLALLLAEHEPRISGVVAFAPATDVERRLQEKLRESRIDGERYFPGMTDFMRKSSPTTHVDMLNCPVLLLHAADDGNVTIADSRGFQSLLLSRGKNSTLHEFSTGGHFEFMPSVGIPIAVNWLNKVSDNKYVPPLEMVVAQPDVQAVPPQQQPMVPPGMPQRRPREIRAPKIQFPDFKMPDIRRQRMPGQPLRPQTPNGVPGL